MSVALVEEQSMRTPVVAFILLGLILSNMADAGTSMVSNPRAERLANNTYSFAKPKTESGLKRPLLCRIIRCTGDRGERR